MAHRTWHCSLSGACHLSRPLGFGVVDRWSPLSSCGTRQSGAFWLRCSDLCIVHCSLTSQSTIGRSWPLLRWLTGHVRAHRVVQWIIAERLWKPESSQFTRCSAWAPYSVWCIPDSVWCATGSTNACLCSKLCRVPQLIFFVGSCWTLYTWDKWKLGKLVSPRGLWWTSNTKIDYRKCVSPFPFQSPPFWWLMPT
jgi:hypothetical protein